MAKDLVRTRQAIQKFYKLRAELQAVSLIHLPLFEDAAAVAGIADLVAELRGQPAGGLEDWRVLFATDLYAYYGQPAQKLSLAQVGYYAVYRSTLADEDKNKDKRK